MNRTCSHAPSLALVALITACGGSLSPTGDVWSSAAAGPGGATSIPPQSDVGPPASAPPFSVVTVSVPDGAPWELNRPIDVEFNKDVDLATVSTSTIGIVESSGATAVGTFTLPRPRIVRFQPACPTTADGTDGGLVRGGSYDLDVPDLTAGGAATVMSTAGELLRFGASVDFSTPDSSDPSVLYFDPVPGPPRVRVRGQAGEPADSLVASFVEFGDGTVEYLEQDPMLQVGRITGVVPLNLYSRIESRFSVVLRFDQPIAIGVAQASPPLVGLEYSYDQVTWEPAPAALESVDNCTANGGSLRVAPAGIAPQGASLRVVVRAGFADITGEALTAPITDAAVLDVDVADPGGASPADGSDEVLESFSAGGPGSLEDPSFPTTVPRADWGGDGDTLSAAFDFEGTGGPGGNFDWYVRSGSTFILDTSFDQVVGGPNGVPAFVQDVVGGVLQVDDLVVEQNARLIVVGPNPLTVLATGEVLIDGIVSLDGSDSNGVTTLNTTNVPEIGAPGQAGGGDGGLGSPLTSASSPKGGDGFGAFDVPGGGGRGGETSYAPAGFCDRENRRGAGGGGGRLGPDVRYDYPTGGPVVFLRSQTLVGMDAEPGFTGSPDGTGAISQSAAAAGGPTGLSPFVDGRDDNDFLGSLVTPGGDVVAGELPGVWAGAGGGGGGDASRTSSFPLTPFSPTGDEKGAGGGGGAGGVLVVALGAIELGPNGTLHADGGDGGGGENTVFFDRIGGGSGGGSGGHVVLSSATRIVVAATSTAPETGPFYLDDPIAPVHDRRPLRALGGQGGAGKDDRCGATVSGPTQWRADAIPFEAFEGVLGVPPQNQNAWLACNRIDACSVIQPPEGTTPGAGGDGGPGLIQLHVHDPAANLLFPGVPGTYGVDLDPTRSMVPPPVGWTRPSDPAGAMVPFVAARSAAVSRWIPLGLARLEPPAGSVDRVEFLFGGTDLGSGEVLRDAQTAAELPPVFDYAALSVGGAAPSVDVPSATFTIPGAGFDALYRDNAALLREFAVRIRASGSTAFSAEFTVQAASYDAAAGTFALVVDPLGTGLADTIAGTFAPEVAVVPFFFRLRSGGVLGLYPAGTSISIGFDAALVDPATGLPSDDPADSIAAGRLEGFVADVGVLNLVDWDFFRFKVEFGYPPGPALDPQTPPPGLDLLRVPYRF